VGERVELVKEKVEVPKCVTELDKAGFKIIPKKNTAEEPKKSLKSVY